MINQTDQRGGAARIAWDLMTALRTRGHECRFAVARKLSRDAAVQELPGPQPNHAWSGPALKLSNLFHNVARSYPGLGLGRVYHILRFVARQPDTNAARKRSGYEVFDWPTAKALEEHVPWEPDLIHAHNLHPDYFDLNCLAAFSRRFPMLVTMHDRWLFTGGCQHSIGCEAWREGCGACPDEMLPITLNREATAANWRVKRDIYARSRLFIATPSQWLLDQARASILMEGVVESRVIHNGVDLERFQPGDRIAARRARGLPEHGTILLFVAAGLDRNPWKDWPTLREAAERLGAARTNDDILFLGLGARGEGETHGRLRIEFRPYESDLDAVVDYYRAADCYLHAARADTFPNVVLEALACGTPVVATRVGGVPEQVRPLALLDAPADAAPLDSATGALVDYRDGEALARAVHALLDRPETLALLGDNSARDARRRFDVRRMIDEYEVWYAEIRERHAREN